MANKGGPFEREVCKKLSRWWTGNDEDSVFWRTSQSGGRATTRRKKGQKTSGQCSDICSTDPCSLPFTKLISPECKRGYGDSGPGDMMDRPKVMRNKHNQTQFEAFLEQAITAQENEGTPYWMVIHRRDKHKEMVYFPADLLHKFRIVGALNPPYPPPFFEMTIRVNFSDGSIKRISFVGMKLDALLCRITPQHIHRIRKMVRGR